MPEIYTLEEVDLVLAPTVGSAQSVGYPLIQGEDFVIMLSFRSRPEAVLTHIPFDPITEQFVGSQDVQQFAESFNAIGNGHFDRVDVFPDDGAIILTGHGLGDDGQEHGFFQRFNYSSSGITAGLFVDMTSPHQNDDFIVRPINANEAVVTHREWLNPATGDPWTDTETGYPFYVFTVGVDGVGSTPLQFFPADLHPDAWYADPRTIIKTDGGYMIFVGTSEGLYQGSTSFNSSPFDPNPPNFQYARPNGADFGIDDLTSGTSFTWSGGGLSGYLSYWPIPASILPGSDVLNLWNGQFDVLTSETSGLGGYDTLRAVFSNGDGYRYPRILGRATPDLHLFIGQWQSPVDDQYYYQLLRVFVPTPAETGPGFTAAWGLHVSGWS